MPASTFGLMHGQDSRKILSPNKEQVMAEAYESSDYAGLKGGRFRFYYGYEETDAEGNWQFVAYEGGQERVSFTAQALGAKQFDQPSMVLMKGIARYMDLAYPQPTPV